MTWADTTAGLTWRNCVDAEVWAQDGSLICCAKDKDTARLISAAPEMLLALRRARELEESNHGQTSHFHAYNQAIMKAEGKIV